MSASGEIIDLAPPETLPNFGPERAVHGAFFHLVRPDVEGVALDIVYPGSDEAIRYGDYSVDDALVPVMTIRDRAAARTILTASTTKGPARGVGELYMDGEVDFVHRDPAVTPTRAAKAAITAIGATTDTSSPWYHRLADARGAVHGVQRRLDAYTRRFGLPLMESNKPEDHYDPGDRIIELFVDPTGTYSCAIFPDNPEEATLEQAQRAKIDLMWRKADTQDGDHVLDIGCGDGEALVQLAKEHENVTGVGVTRSEEQAKAARAKIAEAGLQDRLKIIVKDFKELAEEPDHAGVYDRIISIGMFEHVGREHHLTYMRAIRQMMKDDGVSALHTIVKHNNNPMNGWIRVHAFPGGDLPTNAGVNDAAMHAGLVVVDQQDRTLDYEETLDRWGDNFEAQIEEVRRIVGGDEREVRRWRLYLASSSAFFRIGRIGLSQFVITGAGNRNRPRNRGTRMIEYPNAA